MKTIAELDDQTIAQLERHRPIRFEKSDIFMLWPVHPGQVVQYGKYFLRWVISQKGKWSSYARRGTPQISIDQATWYELKYSFYWKRDGNQPSWYDEKDLEKEIGKARKSFLQKRANIQAKARRIEIKEKAEEAGLTLEDYKAEKRATREKKATIKKNTKKAKKIVNQTNNKMSIAMALKDLRDATKLLQEKLENTECDLLLPYVRSRLHKITEATWVLGQWSKERKKEEEKKKQ